MEFWTLSRTHGRTDPTRDLRLHHGYPHVYYEFLLNMMDLGLQDYVIPFPSPSRMANSFLAQAGAAPELIHIDAAHEYEDAVEDIASWWRLLSPGGMLLGDDFSSSWRGVVRAACEHAQRYHTPLYRNEKKWWVFKPQQADRPIPAVDGGTFNATKFSLWHGSQVNVEDCLTPMKSKTRIFGRQ